MTRTGIEPATLRLQPAAGVESSTIEPPHHFDDV